MNFLVRLVKFSFSVIIFATDFTYRWIKIINIALWIWLFDRLVLSDISSFTDYLLYTYAANAKTQLVIKANLLGVIILWAGSFMFGDIWGA